MCAFDVDDLPVPIGFLLWSEEPRARTKTLGRPRAVRWCRAGMTLWVLVLDDAGPYRRTLEELGHRADPTWAKQVSGSLAGDLVIGFGATIPLNRATDEMARPAALRHFGSEGPVTSWGESRKFNAGVRSLVRSSLRTPP